MDFNVFPSIMKEKLSIEMKKEIDDVKKNCKGEMNITQRKQYSPDFGTYLVTGIVIGLLLGAITNDRALFVFSIIISLIVYVTKFMRTNNYNNSLDVKSMEVKYKYDMCIQAIEKEYSDKISEFSKCFENSVQDHSIKFADSELAKEVIDWMFNGFSNTIEKADRSSHIKKLDIPFKFKVFKNRITCNLGEYNFKVNRCENLQNPIEQSALARAIASSIQLKMVMQYSVDPSGTKASAEFVSNYGDDYIESTIRYIADNGNYQEVKKW